jgi:hypothetical protein
LYSRTQHVFSAGYITSAALQELCRSEAYIHKDAQERLTTALPTWLSHMDSGVLRDMVPMLQKLGWQDEVDRVLQIFQHSPPYDSNDRFLSLGRSLLILEKDPPPSCQVLLPRWRQWRHQILKQRVSLPFIQREVMIADFIRMPHFDVGERLQAIP